MMCAGGEERKRGRGGTGAGGAGEQIFFLLVYTDVKSSRGTSGLCMMASERDIGRDTPFRVRFGKTLLRGKHVRYGSR